MKTKKSYYKLGTMWEGKYQYLPLLTKEGIIIFPHDDKHERTKGNVFLVSEKGNDICCHIAILTSDPTALTADYKAKLEKGVPVINKKWHYAKAKWLVLDEPIKYRLRAKNQGEMIQKNDTISEINNAIVDKVLNFEF